MRRLLLAACLATVVAAPRTSHAGCTSPVLCGMNIDGSLPHGCVDNTGRAYDVFLIPLNANDRITVSTTSHAFVPQLIVAAPTLETRIYEANAGRYSAIGVSFTADIAGLWIVVVENADTTGGGPYSISFQCESAQPQPPANGFMLTATPATVTIQPNQSATVHVTSTAASGFSSPVAVEISGAPRGVTIVPASLAFDNASGTSDVTVSTSDSPVGGTFSLVFAGQATTGETAVTSSVLVVDAPCAPATISIQPKSSSVYRGSAAILTVGGAGTPPLTYQWFAGHSGITLSPLPNATNAELQTPPITADSEFWVRVSNGCGSRDSETATVYATARPPRRRAVHR